MTISIREEEIASTIAKTWGTIVKEDTKGNPGKNPKDGAQRAIAIFNNTYNSPLDFVLIGPDQIRKNEEWVSNFGLITAMLQKAKKAVEVTGAILGEQQWSLLINDAFLLAAICKGKDVILTMEKEPSAKLLWDERLTTLGRELAILQIAGYQRAESMRMSVLSFKAPKPQEEFTLEKIWAELKKIKSPAPILELFKSKC